MSVYEIPVTNEPNQNFRCTIPTDGVMCSLIFDIRYNGEAGYWVMTVSDNRTARIILDSVPLLQGAYPAANILEQYTYLNIGSAYIVKTNPDISEDNPNDRTLGNGFKLFWSDTR